MHGKYSNSWDYQLIKLVHHLGSKAIYREYISVILECDKKFEDIIIERVITASATTSGKIKSDNRRERVTE